MNAAAVPRDFHLLAKPSGSTCNIDCTYCFMRELVDSPRQRKFGQDKLHSLTAQCKTCSVRNQCNGGCPKDRFASSRDGEAGQNYLCPGLELFFTHTAPAFEAMAQLIRRGRYPAELMDTIARADAAGRPPPSVLEPRATVDSISG